MGLCKLPSILSRRNLRNKKGTLFDIFVVIAVIFGLSLFFIILSTVFSDIKPQLADAFEDNNPADAPTNTTQILDKTLASTTRYNLLFPLIMIGIFSYLFISAFFLKDHPVFFIIGIIILAIALMISAIYSNIYHRISETDEFAATTADFRTIDLVMKYAPYFVIAIFIITGAILWARSGTATPTGY